MPLALAPKIYVHLTIHVHRVPSATCTLTPDAAVVDGGHKGPVFRRKLISD